MAIRGFDRPDGYFDVFMHVDGGRRKYCNQAWTGKRKDGLQAGYAEIDGKAVGHPKGVYCLRFEVNARRHLQCLGADFSFACIPVSYSAAVMNKEVM